MKRAIAFTSISVAYVIALVSMFFIDARSLGNIYASVGFGSDTLLHVLAFFFLALLLRLTFSERMYDLERPILHALLYASLIAGLIELMQVLLPTRHALMLDLGLHLLGIAVYGVLDYIVEKIMIKRN